MNDFRRSILFGFIIVMVVGLVIIVIYGVTLDTSECVNLRCSIIQQNEYTIQLLENNK